MEKTAMQMLIEHLEKYKEVLGVPAVIAIDKATELLAKEKEQMVNAYKSGYNNIGDESAASIHDENAEAEDYYNSTYQVKKYL